MALRATYRSAPSRSHYNVMTRCTACWAQQAQLSGGKRQLQLVFRYDIVVWEKLRGPNNSGSAYPMRPGNEVLCDKVKIYLERLPEGFCIDITRSAFDPHSILLELLTQWHGKHEQAWNNSGSTLTTNVTAPNVTNTVVKNLSHLLLQLWQEEAMSVTIAITVSIAMMVSMARAVSHDDLNDQDSHDVQNGLNGHDNYSGSNGHNKVNAMNLACVTETSASSRWSRLKP